MKITTTKASLVAPLSLIAGAADTKGLVPILGSVLLKVIDGQRLSMLCSDAAVLARALAPCDVTTHGEIAVDVRLFGELIRAVPDKQSIEIVADSKGLHIKAGRSKFKLPALSAADYPRMTPEDAERLSLSIDSARLAKMIDDISCSMASADVRLMLNGGLFRIDEKGLWLVASDGNRLAVSHEPIPSMGNIAPKEVIVPRKSALLARKLLLGQDDQVKLTIGPTDFQLTFADSTVLMGKGISSKFPDYQKVIPKTTSDFLMETHRLSDSLTMISAMRGPANGKDGLRDKIDLIIGNKLLTLQKGEAARCEVDTASVCDQDTVISINLQLLADAASIMQEHAEEVSIGYSHDTPTAAITLRPKGMEYPLAVLMPMRG